MLVRLLEIRQQQPDTLAYSTGETSITWSQLYRQSKSIAHQLDKQGVRPRHRICLYLDDCLEWIVIHHAMIMLGAIPAMLHVKTEHMPTVGNFDYIVGEVDKIGTINGYLKIMLHELDFEKINVSISTRILKDIQAIKDGTYVDEGVAMDDTKKDDSKKST